MELFYALISVFAFVAILQPLLWIIAMALFILGAIMRKEKFWD